MKQAQWGPAMVVTAFALATPVPAADPKVIHQFEQKLPADPGAYKRSRRDLPFPDSRVARGTRNIAAAWFSEPVTRYRHFILGAEQEPAELVVSTADRGLFKFTLPPDSVFEDREPRLWDLDGDGNDEIVVVRSYLKTGAALAIFGIKDNALAMLAETPPIGQPFRWLNPAGVGDFDGDGRPDIALVRTPHIGGELVLYSYIDGRLVERLAINDVSNHAIRSSHLRLSAVADFDGDGIADLAIPSADRRALRVLSFKGWRPREIARVLLPATAAEDFAVVTQNGRPAVKVGLGGGRTVVVQP